MIRLAQIGDSHFDSAPGGRFGECVRVHDWIVEDMARRQVDLITHTGDLVDGRPTVEVERAVFAWVTQCAELAPVVIVRGNHDPRGWLTLLTKLRTRHPVIVEEGAGVHVVNGIAVACLAWPQKACVAALARQLSPGAGKDEVDAVAADAMRVVLQGLADQLAQHDGPRTFAGHVMARGSRTSLGQPLVGMDAFEIGLEDLALIPADFFGMGHIHLPQEWAIDSRHAAFTGSPYRTTYGELEEKGYIVAEWTDSTFEGWQRIPTPCTPMVLIEAVYVGGVDEFHIADPQDVPAGAEVRFRYTYPADRVEEAKRAADGVKAQLLTSGAVDVKLDPQAEAVSRARAPEIATATTLADKLKLFWYARGIDLDEDRRAQLVTLAESLQQEARDAV